MSEIMERIDEVKYKVSGWTVIGGGGGGNIGELIRGVAFFADEESAGLYAATLLKEITKDFKADSDRVPVAWEGVEIYMFEDLIDEAVNIYFSESMEELSEAEMDDFRSKHNVNNCQSLKDFLSILSDLSIDERQVIDALEEADPNCGERDWVQVLGPGSYSLIYRWEWDFSYNDGFGYVIAW